MNRIEKMIKETVAKIKAEGLDRDQLQKIMIAEDAMVFLAKIITPEIELMLKEQAEIVRNAAALEAFNKANNLITQNPGMIPARISDSVREVKHDWVKLED